MMRTFRMVASATTLALLSGCATTSFAPPMVSTQNKATATGTCKGNTGWGDAIAFNTIDGANELVDNFLVVYRCAANETANGRRFFEIPAYLGVAGTTTAIAFGAGPAVALAGGANSAIMGAGKAYFDPVAKADVFNKAMDALVCIQSESLGVPAFDPKLDPTTKSADGVKSQLEGEVRVSWERQYFKAVEGALLSVETVTRERLRASGTYNPAGLVAEIGALQAAAEKANADAEAAARANASPPPAEGEDASGGANADGLSADQKKGIAAAKLKGRVAAIERESAAAAAAGTQSLGFSTIKLDVMRAQLQLCVARAKV